MLRNLLLATGLIFATSSLDAEQVLRIDAKASTVSFELTATGHTVKGAFDVSSGELSFQRETGSISGQVAVNAASGRTGNARRDAAMHENVLESAKHPHIIFRPASIEGIIPATGEGSATIRGSMSIHGSEYAVAIPLRIQIAGNRVAARASFDVPYVAWGMKDPSVFVLRVAKKVRVAVVLHGTLSGE